MKKVFFTFICFLFAASLFAQSYSLELHLSDGTVVNLPVEEIRKITFEGVIGIEDTQGLQQIIKSFQVLQNYPNPFNPTTTIQYQLPKSGDVEIKIFNVNGQLVRKLLSRFQTSGVHEIVWDGTNDNSQNVSSGFYIYEVKFENSVQTKKMILLK